MTSITPHFSLEEFSCHDGTPYPEEWRDDRLVDLAGMLEAIRVAAGVPITILSGYRTPSYDKRLYDASPKDGSKAPPDKSQHPQGRAADICAEGWSPQRLHDLIIQQWRAGKLPKLGGVGLYPGFVHVDTRPWIGHLAQWSY